MQLLRILSIIVIEEHENYSDPDKLLGGERVRINV
jgi:hypothetical protein